MTTIIYTGSIKADCHISPSVLFSLPLHLTKVARWRSISVSTCRQCVPELCEGERSRAFNSFAQATCDLSDPRFCDVREYGLVVIRGMTKTPDKIGKSRKCTRLGAGIAQWLERRTRDWKVAGSNPCWNGGRIFFSRVDFLCWLLFRYPFHPRVTTVARKRPRSFCQKCRWQVTAKHAYTLRMWILLNRASALVTTCP